MLAYYSNARVSPVFSGSWSLHGKIYSWVITCRGILFNVQGRGGVRGQHAAQPNQSVRWY